MRSLRRVVGGLRPSTIRYRRHLDDRMRVSKAVFAATGGVVQSGAFQGMRLAEAITDSSAKLLGTYEQELHAVVRRVVEASPERVVNVGCSDGFYAVGLKLLLPTARVWAFDASTAMQEATRSTAAINEVELEVGGFLDPESLEAIAAGGRTLVVCDCEGCEYDLLDPARAPSLERASMLVELHDATIVPELAGKDPADLLSRFEPTHRQTLVESEARQVEDVPELEGFSVEDRHLAVFERGFAMRWALLEPR